MTDSEDLWRPQQGYGQQHPQPYDPRQHQQRLRSGQPPQQDAPWERYGTAQEQRQQPEPPPFDPNPALTGHMGQRQAPQGPQHAPRVRSATPLYAGIALVIGIAIGGAAGYALHGSSPAAANAGSATAGAAAARPAPASPASATPDTSAAAKSAAGQFFAFYSAGQWALAWQYLTAADKREAPLKVYETFHNGCPSNADGLAYKIQSVTMAGRTAVATYTIAGAASALGSATLVETWTAAGWKVTGNEMGSTYSHGSASADIAAAKAAGDCAS